MDSQYRLINDSLHVLRQCDMASAPKLRLEVQLFQIKLLLLSDDVDRGTKTRYCGEAVLQELYREIKSLSDGEISSVAIEAVSGHLKQIAVDISREAAGPCQCPIIPLGGR